MTRLGEKEGFVKYCWQKLAEIKTWRITKENVIRATVVEFK